VLRHYVVPVRHWKHRRVPYGVVACDLQHDSAVGWSDWNHLAI